MTWMQIGWGMALITSTWFVPVAAIRVMAYRSGTDATPGMRGVAITTATLAALSVLALVVLTVLIALTAA